MADDIKIRHARADEVDGVATLAARAFRDTFGSVNEPANIEGYLSEALSVERFVEEYADAGNIFLVAHADGNPQIAGYAKLRRDSQNDCVNHDRAMEIERIYVDKPFLGCGAGAALMRHCIAEAQGEDCDGIWLGVWEHNAAAIRFYERWGFTSVGLQPFTLGSELQTDVVMARALDASPIYRNYRSDDHAACLALFDANCPEYFAPQERTDLEQFLQQHAAQYEVCERDGEVVAAFGLRPVTSDIVALNWIMIAPGAQGTGIGSAMMLRSIEKARAAAASRISIAASHRSAAFFSRFGAEAIKETQDGWGPGMHRIDMRIAVE